jgi:hypothetical protein
VRISANEISDLIMTLGAVMIAGSVLIAVLTAALRFGIRPLLADWAKLRAQPGTFTLERRMAELEEEVRQLKVGPNLQLPADPLRTGGRPLT